MEFWFSGVEETTDAAVVVEVAAAVERTSCPACTTLTSVTRVVARGKPMAVMVSLTGRCPDRWEVWAVAAVDTEVATTTTGEDIRKIICHRSNQRGLQCETCQRNHAFVFSSL